MVAIDRRRPSVICGQRQRKWRGGCRQIRVQNVPGDDIRLSSRGDFFEHLGGWIPEAECGVSDNTDSFFIACTIFFPAKQFGDRLGSVARLGGKALLRGFNHLLQKRLGRQRCFDERVWGG